MTPNEKPVYLVRYLDQFLTSSNSPQHSVIAFGTEQDARQYANEAAQDRGVHPSLYRVVEFVPSGKVCEA